MATGQNIVWGGSPSGRVTIPVLFKLQFLQVTTGTNHSDVTDCHQTFIFADDFLRPVVRGLAWDRQPINSASEGALCPQRLARTGELL
jgi:hypothetical protein